MTSVAAAMYVDQESLYHADFGSDWLDRF